MKVKVRVVAMMLVGRGTLSCCEAQSPPIRGPALHPMILAKPAGALPREGLSPPCLCRGRLRAETPGLPIKRTQRLKHSDVQLAPEIPLQSDQRLSLALERALVLQ
jgi:hypothetical protein